MVNKARSRPGGKGGDKGRREEGLFIG